MKGGHYMTEEAKKGFGWGKGCLIAIGVVIAVPVGLTVLGAIVGPPAGSSEKSAAPVDAATKTAPSPAQSVATPEPAQPANDLTGPQQNAARSATQYLQMSGFSREGLIQQLSSDAGDGYARADATAAVDSLTVDWNEQAARSAAQYLKMSGFSCKGLIQQLSSSAGDRYTVSQATYGAKQAGAC